MGNIQHQGWLAGHDLETPGQIDHGHTVSHGLCGYGQFVAQRFKCRQDTRCIDQLIGTAQRRVRQTSIATASSSPVPLLLVATNIEIMAHAPKVCTNFTGVVDNALGRHRITHDRGTPRAHDAGLLTANRLTVRPKKLHMVNVDAGDDGAIRIDDIGGVQPPPQAYFKNGNIEQRMAHQPQDCQGREFEIGQGDFFPPLGARFLHSLEVWKKVCRTDDFAMNPATLLEVHKMGRCVHAGAIPRL